MSDRLLEEFKKLFKVFEECLQSYNDLAKVCVQNTEVLQILADEVSKLSQRLIFLENMDKNKIYIS